MSSMQDGELVLCGGTDNETSCISTRSPGGPWRQHSTMNTHRKSHASAVTRDTLHMVAGGSSRDTASNLEDKRWKEQEKLPYSIGSGSCAVTINETAVFVTGGDDAPMKTAIWNPSTDVWTPMAEMKQGREFHGCSLFTSTGGDKYVLVAGGSYKDGKIWKSKSTSEIYDVQGNTWTFAGNLKQGRRWGVMVSSGNDVYFMGGKGDASTFYDDALSFVNEILDKIPYISQRGKGGNARLDSVEQFNIFTRTWEMTKLKLKKERGAFSAVSVNKNIFC